MLNEKEKLEVIETALNHVRRHCPTVVKVEFDFGEHGHIWVFKDSEGRAPSFEGLPIDLDILEAALDAAWELRLTCYAISAKERTC